MKRYKIKGWANVRRDAFLTESDVWPGCNKLNGKKARLLKYMLW